jgi:hypothetical protein
MTRWMVSTVTFQLEFRGFRGADGGWVVALVCAALAGVVWRAEQAEGGVAATPNPVGVKAHRAAGR